MQEGAVVIEVLVEVNVEQDVEGDEVADGSLHICQSAHFCRML